LVAACAHGISTAYQYAWYRLDASAVCFAEGAHHKPTRACFQLGHLNSATGEAENRGHRQHHRTPPDLSAVPHCAAETQWRQTPVSEYGPKVSKPPQDQHVVSCS